MTSGTGVVTVSSDGLITAAQAGNAVVTATSTLNSEVTATINIAVTASVSVTGVTLNKSSTSLELNASETLIPTITPSNATNQNVTWSSSDNGTVSVYSNGLITGLQAGNATITVTTEDGSFTDTCTVTVTIPTYTQIVINEAYGGGGNSGATYKQDFVELYNNTNSSINLSGYYVFYASATGTFNTSTALSGYILPKSYYLVQEATGTGGTVDIPTSDATGTINMGATGFKLALTNSSTTPTTTNDSNVIDFVGAGSATTYETAVSPAPSNTTSIARTITDGISIDTGDNSADFATGTPTPCDGAVSVANRIMAYESGDIVTAECATKYTTIKTQITSLTSGSLTYFQNSTDTTVTDARARYLAWATANGDTNPYSVSEGLQITFSNYENNIILMLVLSFTGLSTIAVYFVLKKKKLVK